MFLELSRSGKLGCDVWLVHLTGEEFPSDCMGARHSASKLVRGHARNATAPTAMTHDLSHARVQGVYVLDMVAHNNDHDRDVFQISPATGAQSMWLAYQAHLADGGMEHVGAAMESAIGRAGRGRGRRSPDGSHARGRRCILALYGEVRTPYDPHSTLYNTDGQIFSDAGVPVVLFMENYDINRKGYHDTHDTMENIDLDYGAAVTAIAIESVARAARGRNLRSEGEELVTFRNNFRIPGRLLHSTGATE